MMKHRLTAMVAALAASAGISVSCVAAPQRVPRPDPSMFADLLEAPRAGVPPPRQQPAHEPEPPSVPSDQIARLFEEAELVLRSIAANAGSAQDELKESWRRAADVIRRHAEKPAIRHVPQDLDRIEPQPAESRTSTSVDNEVPESGNGARGLKPTFERTAHPDAEPGPAASISVPAGSAAGLSPNPLHEIALKLRELAAEAEANASRFARPTSAEEPAHE